ncbi:MAG TPA: DUF2798 domain-containing protein [Noviherbaspirillum sp.]|nr:DUF2798 domain-containing protein [Noviherbaspirillum sp.]
MHTLSHPYASLPQEPRRKTVTPVMPGQVLYHLRRSRSLASMLPFLFLSGVITLVMTAVMRLMWTGWTDGFVNVWMESWLTAWPIAFPIAYLVSPPLLKLAAYISAPAARPAPRVRGLAFGDIESASARVTANNDLTVLRNLKPAHDFSAV